MRRLAPALPLLAALALPGLASPGAAWGASGGRDDLATVQRGYAIYAHVCSNCHSLRQMTFSDLGEMGLSPEQVRTVASHWQIDGRDGRPTDHFPAPFPDEATARAANNGALPPDMSRLAMTEEGGAAWIERLLTGYRPAAAGTRPTPGTYSNVAATTGSIAMPPPLHDGAVRFADGAGESVPAMAHDVATFLDWAARPHLAQRHRVGASVVIYLLLLFCLVFILKRRVWSNVR